MKDKELKDYVREKGFRWNGDRLADLVRAKRLRDLVRVKGIRWQTSSG